MWFRMETTVVCLWNGGVVWRRQRCSSQGPLTKACPQRHVEEAERSEGRRWPPEHARLFRMETTVVCLWNGGVVWRRQRCSSQGPLTKACPQRHVEEAERSEGRRWPPEHARLFRMETTVVCLWNGGVVWRRQRCSSQGPLTKACPQRHVEEAERSEGRRWPPEHAWSFRRQTTTSRRSASGPSW